MGTLPIEASIVRSAGLNTRCLSYGYASNRAVNFAMQLGNAFGSRMFLDSGAFTLQKQKATEAQIESYMESYASFIQETHGWWDFYATVDHKRDTQVIRKAQKQLQRIGLAPTPVFHGDTHLNWFEEYCKEGYRLICIGRPPKHLKLDLDHFYDSVHNVAEKYGVKLHGLAETGKRMFQYPWWSVDSSSWLFGSAQGMIFSYDAGSKSFSHVYMVQGKYLPGIRTWGTCAQEYKRSILKFAESYRITEELLLTSYAHRNFYNAAVMSEAVRVHKWEGTKKWQTLI